MARISGYSEDDVDVLVEDFTSIVSQAMQRAADRTAANLRPAVIASTRYAFHLPGQHDQKTHGHPGVSGAEALAAPRVNMTQVSTRTEMEELGLTREHLQGLGRYRGTGSQRINDHLRGVEMDPADAEVAQRVTAQIDGAMAQSPLSHTIIVSRGTRTVDWLPPGDDLTGVEWRDKAFTSTTADLETSRYMKTRGGAKLTITVPEGVHAITLSDFSHEAEILLDRGLSFRITHDHGVNANGVRELSVEVIR